MPRFCDVALPVPLDRVFTYTWAVEGAEGFPPYAPEDPATLKAAPQVGCRVLVPFRNEKMAGIVVRLHDEPPPVDARLLLSILDAEPIVSLPLLQLGEWIAQYYLCPLGEVLRTMLPLMAEVRRRVLYRIAEAGRAALYSGAEQGSSRRSRRSPAEQDAEYSVLNYLENGEAARLATLRSATGATNELLTGMLRKKWLTRETEAESRHASRTVRFAVLAAAVVPEAHERTSLPPRTVDQQTPGAVSRPPETRAPAAGARLPRLNENQQSILAELAGAGGSLAVPDLRRRLAERQLPTSQSSLATLVRRGLVLLEERPADFHLSGLGGSGHVHVLNNAQQSVLAAVTHAMETGKFQPMLLHGVTGSGKTAVYLAAMRRALDSGKTTLLLVPEIGLTPAMAGQLHHAFAGDVALLHSQLTPEERAEQWHRIRKGEARVVVGTRSAVFAPLDNLGLIIVDEEHDSSYKQEEMPRYHARDIAVMRAKIAGAAIVLGSATPSLESWQNAIRGRYARLEMHTRVNDRPLPEVELVDMRQEFQQTGQEHLFSRRLIEQTEATLARGEQAIILLNRRGYSFVAMCRACGEKLQCENCAISLTLHKAVLGGGGAGGPREEDAARARAGERLECHYCGYKRTVPRRCPHCDSEHLYYLGAGSQQGEERLQEIFPNARIGRMDRDTVRGRHDMERLLERLHSGEINLLVGTQMIAKGHDIHGVTLVGVVGADYALGLPDFRAAERVFQLLTQVSGRAGRGDLPGQVIVQTYHPDHYSIEYAAKHDYHGFVARELKLRGWMHYPPFGVLANLVIQSHLFEEAAAWAATMGRWFASTPLEKVRVLGPATAPLSKVKRIYRFHLVVKAETRHALNHALRGALAHAEAAGIPRRNLVVDVDAVSLM
jgi:primosomal protein N' (replication factor Y)